VVATTSSEIPFLNVELVVIAPTLLDPSILENEESGRKIRACFPVVSWMLLEELLLPVVVVVKVDDDPEVDDEKCDAEECV
jgi:hypothetical protein